jgi:hypothetical protein
MERIHGAKRIFKTISEGVGEMVEGLSLPVEHRSEIGFAVSHRHHRVE